MLFCRIKKNFVQWNLLKLKSLIPFLIWNSVLVLILSSTSRSKSGWRNYRSLYEWKKKVSKLDFLRKKLGVHWKLIGQFIFDHYNKFSFICVTFVWAYGHSHTLWFRLFFVLKVKSFCKFFCDFRVYLNQNCVESTECSELLINPYLYERKP